MDEVVWEKNYPPSKRMIRDYWADWLVKIGKFDSVQEVKEAYYCFACGFDHGGVVRAHIKARCHGGNYHPSNMHLLCQMCHEASEYVEGDKYFEWLRKMTIWNVAGGVSMMHPEKWPEGVHLIVVDANAR